jgi:hypothetical protein
MATTPRPPALPPWMPTRETTLKAAAATVGLAGILAGCSSGTKDNGSAVASTVKQTTTTVAPTTTAPTTTAAPATTAAATPAGAPAAAPSGAQQLQNASANGATYWRYSVTGTTPAQVVSDYQGELQAAGYSVTDQGGSGGGWGKWGGAGAGPDRPGRRQLRLGPGRGPEQRPDLLRGVPRSVQPVRAGLRERQRRSERPEQQRRLELGCQLTCRS